MGRAGLFEDVDVEDAVGLGRVGRLGFDAVEDAGVDVDHAAGRQFEALLFERAAGLGVIFPCKHSVRCGVLGGRDAVAARDNFQVAVAASEAVQIVENLDIVFFAFGQVDGILMLPVMMVLVIAEGTDAARGNVEGGVAVVIVVADGGAQQRGDEGVVDQLVGVGAAIIPWADEVGFGIGLKVRQLADVVANLIESFDLLDEGLPGLVGEDVWIGDVAVVVEGIDVGLGGAGDAEERVQVCCHVRASFGLNYSTQLLRTVDVELPADVGQLLAGVKVKMTLAVAKKVLQNTVYSCRMLANHRGL